MDLSWIKKCLKDNQYLFTLHADEERRSDGLEIADIENAILNGRILEEYPNDRRGYSCLICGESRGKPIHIVCGKNSAGWLVIITVYIPSLPKWETPVKRKKI